MKNAGIIMDDQLSLSLSNLKEEVTKIVRRVDVMQKSLDILYKDREILEKIIADISQLKSLVLSNREHQETMMKDVKTEVTDTKDTLQNNISTLVDTIDKSGVSENNPTFIDSIKKKIGIT